MEPKTLLDTDVLSALMRRESNVLNRTRAYLSSHAVLTISLITRFEILRGLKARMATTKLKAFDAFCASNEVLPVTEGVVVRAAEIYAELYRSGQLIPDADILIAATAMEHGLIVATNNMADFGRITGLSLDNWLA
jgi:tRNA(fMet)-specific endonuclease VapC